MDITTRVDRRVMNLIHLRQEIVFLKETIDTVLVSYTHLSLDISQTDYMHSISVEELTNVFNES